MDKTTVIKREVAYGQLWGERWAGLQAKLSHTPTTNVRAAQLRRVVKAWDAGHKKLKHEYDTEFLPKFAKLNEDGSIFRPESNPSAFEVVPEKQKDFDKALEGFSKKMLELEMEGPPLRPDALADIKMSAAELEMLGDFYTEDAGPGVPALHLQK